MGNLKDNILSRKKPLYLAVNGVVLSSAESAQRSGLYRVEHDCPGLDGETFIQKGTTLPFCQDCGNPIKFRLVKAIDSITEDPDFR